MKCWISGSAGYVGSALVPHLLSIGCKVVAFDCQWFGDGALPKSPHLKVIEGDIRDANRAAASMVGCDAIVHLAGLTSDRGCQLEPELSDDVNIEAFKGLIQAAANLPLKRFVFLSSAAAYGSTPLPVDEQEKLSPTTRYALAKLYCEGMLRRTTLPWVILRPAGVCGYAPRMRFDLTVNRMVRDAHFLGEIHVHGGDQVRPNLHIRDLLAAIKVLLTTSRSVNGQVFNLGCDNLTVMEVAKIVSATTGASVYVTARQDNRSYSIDSSKIKRELDFMPRFTIESAAYDLFARFKSGYWQDAMTNTNYMNVRGVALENESSPS